MRIEILSDAENDLIAGATFYERRRAGLGGYFLSSLYSDIDSLLLYAGIHRVVFGFHRALSCDFLMRFFIGLIGRRTLFEFTEFWICAVIPFGSGNDSGSAVSTLDVQEAVIGTTFSGLFAGNMFQ
jgi:hypothetical protein